MSFAFIGRRHHLALAVAGGLLAACGMLTAHAQTWPSKPLRIVVPYPAGGGIDVMSRLVGQQLSQRLGQAVVIDNRPGAGTVLAAEIVAKAPADGYTLMVTTDSTVTINQHLYAKLPYDPVKDFAPVTQLVLLNQLLLANPALPANNLKELVTYAKANPGKLNFGTTGNASVEHLSLERLKAHTGIVVERIPYGGGMGQLIPALISGEIDLFVFGPLPFIGHVKEGTVRSLAVASAKRSAVFPAVPTLAEAGFPNDLFMGTTFTLFAPGRTPDKLVGEISALVAGVVNSDKFRDKFAARGLVTRYEAPEPVMRKLDDIDGRVAPMIKAMSLSLV